MLTSLRLKRAAARNRISGHSPISIALSLTAGDWTAGASSSYSSLSNAQDPRLLQPRNNNHAILAPSTVSSQQFGHGSYCCPVPRACFSSEAATKESTAPSGMKALWNHNVYGLTPSIASAHYLLLHAKEKNDANLMVKIMRVMKKNSLPLQAGTAGIVFSICYNGNDWALMKKYSRRFLKAGVKLHRTAFDIWMEFAAKRGDAASIWKIERLRSKAVKNHTIASGFSCAKDLPDKKKAVIADELVKLVVEWSKQVLKRQKKEDREALAEALKSDISAMAASLLNMGIDAKVNAEELHC